MIDNFLHSYLSAYHSLPQGVKVFIGSLYGKIPLAYRFGNKYDVHLDVATKFEAGTEQFKLDYVYNKLYELLNFSYQHISYYRNKFDEYGVAPRDLKAPEDIRIFPPTEKFDVRQHIDSMYTEMYESKKLFFTGGSMSEPTKFYLPFHTARAKEKAYINYVFDKIGAHVRSRKLLLKGREVVDKKSGKLFEFEPVENSFVVSSNHVTDDEYVLAVYDELVKFNPEFVFGYPSAVLDLTKTLIRLNKTLPVEGVILVSENVYDEQLRYLADFFGGEVLSQYGHTERCVMAYRVGAAPYKFMNSYGVHILVGNEIVATGLDNFVMPLINYKTNDFVEGPAFLGNGSGVLSEAARIQGRLQEFLVTKDKRLVSICTMGAGHFSSIQSVDSIQYAQNEVGRVKFVVQSKIKQDLNKIREELMDFTSQSIDFEVVQVEGIEKSVRGKKILCVQELDIESYR